MAEWFGQHLWAIWLCLALLLGSAEMFSGDLILLMLAAGALAGVATSLIAPGLILVQVIVGVLVAILTMFLLRPVLLSRMRNSVGYRSSVDQIVGSEGVATREITAAAGEVRVRGETWSARAYDPDLTIDAGEPVDIFEVDGVTALVHPRNRPMPELPPYN
ncbi:NfeD family protein [Naumannella sp. ID2617S]|nr:NfeD family protein [Naumannella sp. ID2617S]